MECQGLVLFSFATVITISQGILITNICQTNAQFFLKKHKYLFFCIIKVQIKRYLSQKNLHDVNKLTSLNNIRKNSYFSRKNIVSLLSFSFMEYSEGNMSTLQLFEECATRAK